MSIIRHNPGRFLSAAVEHGNTVYVSGQVPDDLSADIKGQTRQVLQKIDTLLAKAGTDKSRLLSANIWLADIRSFDQMNEVWMAWVDPANLPARATVEAKLGRVGMGVEIAAICAK